MNPCLRLFMPVVASLAMASAVAQTPQPPLQLYAAGSLREALTAVAQQFEAQSGRQVVLTFGASGLLRERIEKGEPAQLFASADMDHPQRLAQQGGWQAPAVFALNQMCALAAPGVDATPDSLLDTMLRPGVRLGTSTPKADPAGDYAWALFRRAEALRAGSFAALENKALQLTGGANSPKPPAGQGTYAWVMDQGQADIFLTYCTNAVAAQREVPRLQLRPELAQRRRGRCRTTGPLHSFRAGAGGVAQLRLRPALRPSRCSCRQATPYLEVGSYLSKPSANGRLMMPKSVDSVTMPATSAPL
jgi:molybdate transport system substrate-binding protein